MKARAWIWTFSIGLMLVLVAVADRAQQAAGVAEKAKGKAGKAPTAPPPITWPSPPLADGPIVLETGIQRQIRLIVTKGLNQPWSMAFLPDGAILITERPGRLRIVRNGVLNPAPVAGVPQAQAQGLGGLMDLALHPRFSENQLIYFTSHISAAQNGNASRIVFGKDGMVYMTVGVGDPPAAASAQDPSSLAGKVLRLRDDGSVPPDNPFVGRASSSSASGMSGRVPTVSCTC